MVRFENVTKVFPNGYVGLQEVSFVANPGEVMYLIGESGAGKTTVLRLLIRELLPTSGEIFLHDQNVGALNAGALPYLRRQIGVVFQDYQLLPERTVGENIALVLEILGIPQSQWAQQIDSVLDLVDLEDKVDVFPRQLSGGELQRVAIARALAMTPSVLFADEPTGNLDAKTAAGIGQLLAKIADLGTTVIVSTHDANLLRNFPGNEVRLHQGKIVTPEKKKTSREKSEKEEDSARKENKKRSSSAKNDEKVTEAEEA